MEQSIRFWCPIEKAKDAVDPSTGEPIMRLGGIASTADEDADGEFLDPQGFDIEPLIKSGFVNWHHQAKGQPNTIIGEPSKAEIRPEGLYIETDLYPSSAIACEVWELANTLEKDSKTRRLGYSIEGKVLKRKSEDKTSPDYKHVEKAIITGVAITHMPKNPKTFANIIKGEGTGCEEEEDELEKQEEPKKDEKEEKSLSTENGRPLIREHVDGQEVKKTCYLTKSEVYERLFRDLSNITLLKAERIYNLIENISRMNNNKTVTEEDILKAYETLGLEYDEAAEQLAKGDGCCDPDGGKEKELAKSGEAEDEDDEPVIDDDDVEEEDDDDEDDDTEKAVEGDLYDRIDTLEKAIADSHRINTRYIKALGVMVKDTMQRLEKAASREEELLGIIKGQEETISDMNERLETILSDVPAPKSISAARPVERAFAKGSEDEMNKGGESKQVSMSKNPNLVAEILDQATFAKGYDSEFSKACTSFEATHTLPGSIIARVKNELGIEIVK